MSNLDKFEYKGPERIYKSSLAEDLPYIRERKFSVNPSGGYHDLDYLQEQLDLISGMCGRVTSIATQLLSKFSLKIDQTDTRLVEAHDIIYPDDKTPGYITFDEYKYLLSKEESNAVQLVRAYYEKKLRGPSGTPALDYLLLARSIHAEVGRIRTFIETYIGDVNEDAEFRTVELFQDWTEDTVPILQRLEASVKTQVTSKLPGTELAELTPDDSARYQSTFQAKVNENNRLIHESMGQLDKYWNRPANLFYDRNLGPGLAFQVRVAPQLTDPVHLNNPKIPTLAAEANATISGLSANFSMALKDQLQRNQNFRTTIDSILNNIEQRDVYKNYVVQLADKGKTIASPFVNSSSVEQTAAILNAPHPLTHQSGSVKTSTTNKPSHYDLDDRLDANAHPQYLSKAGGTITGDVKLLGTAKIDGIVPSKHKHDGKDGSVKISGSDIEFGSVTPDNVSSTPSTSTPKNLSVLSQSATVDGAGGVTVSAEVAFEVDNPANIVGYEFQVVKLS